MLRVWVISLLMLITAYARAADGELPAFVLDPVYVNSVDCRGGMAFWHIVAQARNEGVSEQAFIADHQAILSPQLNEYLDTFYQVPPENVLSWLVERHGECIQGSMGISAAKGSWCFARYLQPFYIKLWGPDPAAKPLPWVDGVAPDIKADKDYVSCLKGEVAAP